MTGDLIPGSEFTEKGVSVVHAALDRLAEQRDAAIERAEKAEKVAEHGIARQQVEGQIRLALEHYGVQENFLRHATDNICQLFGIPDESDLIEEKAKELYEAVNQGYSWHAVLASGSLLDIQVVSEYRGIARYVLTESGEL